MRTESKQVLVEPPAADNPALKEIVRRLVSAYRPERIYLFGSVARGEASPDSDYDLLVIVPDEAPPEQRRSRSGLQSHRETANRGSCVHVRHALRKIDRRCPAAGSFLRKAPPIILKAIFVDIALKEDAFNHTRDQDRRVLVALGACGAS